ncbi:MAG: [Fe-Fe] hydrogenase large subunit C-terminal domain-containing protein [Oscillospiraceae bacterium]
MRCGLSVGALSKKAIHRAGRHLRSGQARHLLTAPAIRATLGECLTCPWVECGGQDGRRHPPLGADPSSDGSDGGPDRAVEEAHELLELPKSGGTLPASLLPGLGQIPDIITPICCPIFQLQIAAADVQRAAQAIIARNTALTKKLFVVSVIPCTAKKYEVGRPEEKTYDYQDVDVALTRELAKMIRGAGIKFADLRDEAFDAPFDTGSGAGTIFGATGGVMEAALRTGFLLAGRQAQDGGAQAGPPGHPEDDLQIWAASPPVRVAVTSGLANARKLLEKIKSGKADYQMVEVIACPAAASTAAASRSR